ncbi:MAG TPA: ABC transporter ATP-binding protein, partial [Pirellulales bacterium]
YHYPRQPPPPWARRLDSGQSPPMATRRTAITHWERDRDREADSRPLDLGLVRRLASYTKPHARLRNQLIVLTIMRSIQLPILAWFIGAVIDGPAAGTDVNNLAVWSAAFLLWAAFTQVSFHYRIRYALELGESIVCDLRTELFNHLQQLPMGFYTKTKLGRIISRMTSDVENVRIGVQDVFFVSVVSLGQMLVSFALMVWTDWVLALLVAASAPILYWLNQHFRARLSKAYREVQESFSRVTSTLAESVNGIRVTQSFVRQDVNAEVFSDLVQDHSAYNLKAARLSGILMPLLELNGQVVMSLVLLVGGWRLMQPDHTSTAGSLVQFFFLANTFFMPIQILGNQYNQALTSMAGAERLFKLLDTPPAWTDPPDAQPLPPIAGRVEFENVSFGYDPERLVLQAVDLVVEPGKTIALVGHTGSGKTTLVNLLAKFYLPTGGRILIDGRDSLNCESRSLRQQLGVVSQMNFLFTGTVRENIRLAKADATDEEVRQAARDLDCLDLFDGLPNGLETQVGERGASLSLGQRQLVCFARAMLADPRILILDEATSAVDTLTEVRIQRALAKLTAGRTCFIIAHRLSTIRSADLILVLDHGRIIERGNHEELLRAKGPYARLYEQFARSGQAGPLGENGAGNGAALPSSAGSHRRID